jgi:hypothetical protein
VRDEEKSKVGVVTVSYSSLLERVRLPLLWKGPYRLADTYFLDICFGWRVCHYVQ